MRIPVARRLSEELSRIEQYVEMVLVYLRLDSESKDHVFRKRDLIRSCAEKRRNLRTVYPEKDRAAV